MNPALLAILQQIHAAAKQDSPVPPCPHCGPAAGRVIKHGHYRRSAYCVKHLLAVQRYRCRRCRATFSVPPFPLLPRVQASLTYWLALRLVDGRRALAAARRLAGVSRNTIRRWCQSARWLLEELARRAFWTEPGLDWPGFYQGLSRLLRPGTGRGGITHTT